MSGLKGNQKKGNDGKFVPNPVIKPKRNLSSMTPSGDIARISGNWFEVETVDPEAANSLRRALGDLEKSVIREAMQNYDGTTPEPKPYDTAMQTSIDLTRHLGPSYEEREEGRRILSEWCADTAEDQDIVWWNAKENKWLPCFEEGLQNVWMGRSFDYAERLDANGAEFRLTLEGSGEILKIRRRNPDGTIL